MNTSSSTSYLFDSYRPSYGDPLTPPPTIRKSWYVKMQTRLATLAVFIFVFCIVISIILVLANWHKI
uniref:Movement protein n=1 Tax=Caenorhabditis tropicalis TaxID=1561998 RepID=A0A1I7TYD5_9PELO